MRFSLCSALRCRACDDIFVSPATFHNCLYLRSSSLIKGLLPVVLNLCNTFHDKSPGRLKSNNSTWGKLTVPSHSCYERSAFEIIAELAERSPIIIKNSSNPSSWKNLNVRPYVRTTVWPYKVLLLTCVVNCTAGTPTPRLCPVVSALGSESDDPGSSPGRGKALCPWDVREKKNASSAFRFG